MIPKVFAGMARWVVAPVFVCSGCAMLHTSNMSHQVAPLSLISDLQARAELARDWNLTAEVVTRHRQHGGRIKLVWRQRPDRFQLRVSAATGATLAVINVAPDDETTAMDARGNRYRTETPRQMVEELLGFPLPVEHMKYWVLGAPSPRDAYRDARQADTRLVSFWQSGWRIRYQYRESDTASWPRVKQIEMTSADTRAVVTVQSLVARNRQSL